MFSALVRFKRAYITTDEIVQWIMYAAIAIAVGIAIKTRVSGVA